MNRTNSHTSLDRKPDVEELEILPTAVPDALSALFNEDDLAFYRGFSDDAQSKAWRKVDWRLIPMLTLLYLFSYIDRANIGNAKIEGMTTDLKMSGIDYNIVSAVFFVTYCLFQLPSNIILQRYFIDRPSLWIAGLTVTWGAVMTLHGVVKDTNGLLIVRLMMGIPEAGFFPGAIYLVATWYPKNMVQQRISLFYTASAAAGAFSGLLAFLIVKMDGLGGYSGWRWIFLLEGLLTVVLGIACPWILIDSPDRAQWLDDDERRFIKLSKLVQDGVSKPPPVSGPIDWPSLKAMVTDWQVYLIILVYWSNLVPNYAIKFTLPTIIKGMGFTSNNAQLMTIPCYFLGAVSAVVSGRYADRLGRRFPFIIGAQSLVIIGYAIIFPLAPRISTNIGPCYFALCLASLGFYPIIPGSSTWLSNNLSGPAKRAMGIGYSLCWGNAGGVIASFIYLESEAPAYATGYGSSIAFAIAGAVAACTLEYNYSRINKARDRVPEEETRAKYTAEELAAMGDRSPLYRYTL